MKYFNWKKIYEIGIPDVDKQHQQIFDIVNKFYTELFSENYIQDTEHIYNILKELRDYCDTHFRYERSLYSEEIVSEYFLENGEVISKINILTSKKQVLNIIDLYVFAEYLRKWVVKHVLLLNDKSFKDVLKKEVVVAN